MTQNEKYIAFTRALSKLTIVIDEELDLPKTSRKGKRPNASGSKPKNGGKRTKGDNIHYGKVVKKKHRKTNKTVEGSSKESA
jgi:hypothetical protein